MAQLSDDCFAFGGKLLPVDELESIIAQRIAPVGETETVPLHRAIGRAVAQDVLAPISLPPFDNSAVDGYAVRHTDLSADGETRLRIVGRLQAGSAAVRALDAGEAIRLFTGAPMPPGADTVFMQEDVRADGDAVIVPPGLKGGANRRLAGEDTRAGTVAIPAGRVIGSRHVALLAGLGLTQVAVRRRVRVAVFSTGNEVVEPGGARGGAGIFDANRYLLAGLIEQSGAQASDLGILRDEPDSLAAALKAAARDHDLIVTSGGVSTGEADYVRDAVEKIGTLVFWRVAIKPGRPVALGVIAGKGNDAAFVGLPGNPVAAYVTYARVLRPLILRLAGAEPQPLVPLPVRAAFTYKKKKDRREYVRVALRHAADGSLEAVKHPQDGAGVITSLTETDGLVELPEALTRVEPGTMVGFLPYAVIAK